MGKMIQPSEYYVYHESQQQMSCGLCAPHMMLQHPVLSLEEMKSLAVETAEQIRHTTDLTVKVEGASGGFGIETIQTIFGTYGSEVLSLNCKEVQDTLNEHPPDAVAHLFSASLFRPRAWYHWLLMRVVHGEWFLFDPTKSLPMYMWRQEMVGGSCGQESRLRYLCFAGAAKGLRGTTIPTMWAFTPPNIVALSELGTSRS